MSDLAYAEIYFGDKAPPSILQVPGAKDIAVEFTSLSKTYSMPGWRMGFAAGNQRLINALTRMKSYLDYGAFTPIQVAADGGAERAAGLRAGDARPLSRAPRRADPRPARRRLGRALPGGSMFAWAPIPRALRRTWAASSSASCCWRAPSVAVAPGIGFGEHGDGHVRIALVENTHRLRQALRNIRAFLQRRHQRRPPGGAERSRSAGMTRPLSVGVAGLGTVGAGRAASCCATTPTSSPPAPAGRSRSPPSRPATARATAASPLAGLRWYDDPVALAADPRSMWWWS